MYTNKQRIAIARIVSDMIKADNIIEESEIQMLNRFKELYQIKTTPHGQRPLHAKLSTPICLNRFLSSSIIYVHPATQAFVLVWRDIVVSIL
jgi:hypothetical protein